MLTSLQTMVTRQFDIFDPVVVTAGYFRAGTRRNIIPQQAMFDATVRTFSPAARERIAAASVRLCQSIAAAHGLEAEVTYSTEYPVTVNDPVQAAFASGVVEDVFGPDRFTPMRDPDAGAEDFSRVLERVPGCYLFLGACTRDDFDAAEDNHSPLAQFDDSVLADGCLLHANLAIRGLQSISS
jgi:hippurate hydrolase